MRDIILQVSVRLGKPRRQRQILVEKRRRRETSLFLLRTTTWVISPHLKVLFFYHGHFSGPSRRRAKANSELSISAIKRFQAVISMLHSQISQHRNGNIFHNPIKDSEAPDYHEIVKRPMDLKTVKTRIKDGAISNSDDYQREIYLMFANAMMYNRPKSDIYRMAHEVSIFPMSRFAIGPHVRPDDD